MSRYRLIPPAFGAVIGCAIWVVGEVVLRAAMSLHARHPFSDPV